MEPGNYASGQRGQAKEQRLWRIGIEAYECRNEKTEEKVIAHIAKLI